MQSLLIPILLGVHWDHVGGPVVIDWRLMDSGDDANVETIQSF